MMTAALISEKDYNQMDSLKVGQAAAEVALSS